MTPQERAYQTGREFCPKLVSYIYVYQGNFKGFVDCGDMYYETDPCETKESAAAELRGFLEKLKEQINEKLKELS